MFDRYDNERTLWNLRYNICLQRFVIWNCDNLQLLVSLVTIKQLLIIIDNLFDPYCNNYSPQRAKHDSTNIINHMSHTMAQNFWLGRNESWVFSHHWLSTQESVLSLIASYLNVKISLFILSIFSYKNDHLRKVLFEIFSCLESWLFELMLNMDIRLVAKLQDLSMIDSQCQESPFFQEVWITSFDSKASYEWHSHLEDNEHLEIWKYLKCSQFTPTGLQNYHYPSIISRIISVQPFLTRILTVLLSRSMKNSNSIQPKLNKIL